MAGDVDQAGTVTRDQHFEGWRRCISATAGDLEQFLNYFDSAGEPDRYFKSGFWDLSYHVLKPRVLPLIGEPFDKTVLEIGYGGGRLLNAAASFFGKAVGIDIHDQLPRVESILRGLGNNNFELHQTDGEHMPLPDASIDFAYSYIVLQHLPTLAVLETILGELRRVLKPGAAAILHFGLLDRSWLRRGPSYFDLDSRPEPIPRNVTFRLTVRFARKLLRAAGFTVLETGRSHKKPWLRHYGGQFYAIAQADS